MYLDSINTLPNQKINRISHQRCSVKGVLRNFTKFIRKYLCEMQNHSLRHRTSHQEILIEKSLPSKRLRLEVFSVKTFCLTLPKSETTAQQLPEKYP